MIFFTGLERLKSGFGSLSELWGLLGTPEYPFDSCKYFCNEYKSLLIKNY